MSNPKDLAALPYLSARETEENKCNHRQGGSISNFPHGGTAPSHSVIKHRLPSGGLWVTCTRCGKEWHPINFTDKTLATPGWEEAIYFETTNVTSAGCQFAIPEVAIHQQIENWCSSVSRAQEESRRLSRCITELDRQKQDIFKKFHPEKFLERLKLVFRILTR
jgi:hypothetical protein